MYSVTGCVVDKHSSVSLGVVISKCSHVPKQVKAGKANTKDTPLKDAISDFHRKAAIALGLDDTRSKVLLKCHDQDISREIELDSFMEQ